MTRYIEYKGKIITASTDVELLRCKYEAGDPILLIIDESNECEDTTFAKFATLSQTIDEIDEDYLNLILCRNEGIPVTIAETERLIIRELIPEDSTEILHIYKEAEGFIENFFDLNADRIEDSYEEIKIILSDYIRNTYDFYGYGIWGICLKSNVIDGFNREELPESDRQDDGYKFGRIIGIAGVSPRDDNRVELGYALMEKYRNVGYAFEACRSIVDLCLEDLDVDHITIQVDSTNISGRGLGEKLTKYSDKVTLIQT